MICVSICIHSMYFDSRSFGRRMTSIRKSLLSVWRDRQVKKSSKELTKKLTGLEGSQPRQQEAFEKLTPDAEQTDPRNITIKKSRDKSALGTMIYDSILHLRDLW